MAQPQPTDSFVNEEKLVPPHVSVKEEQALSEPQTSQLPTKPENDGRQPVPLLTWKLASIVLVTAIGFGSQWSSGVTAAMKSTIKKELHINNTQFALLEASEDFMVTALMLVSGIVTDRVGGAGTRRDVTRSYKFMMADKVVRALGDIATQVAQYKVFSSWFAPGNGFASTLGFELGVDKIGAFAGKSSANIILAHRRYHGTNYPATGEKLTDKTRKFEYRKALELPWTFWAVIGFSLFETSAAIVFLQNATELAEQRCGTDSISAGWYSSVLQYSGFFVVPLLGVFLHLYGSRISVLVFCGIGMLISMLLYTHIDVGQNVFGSAYSIKITMNNAMNIIVRIITGKIQDADNNSYDRVTIVYVILAGVSVLVSLLLAVVAWKSVDLGHLQWTRKKRIAQGALLNERKAVFTNENGEKNRRVSLACFAALILLILGSWCGYFWGVATGNND
ncbi:major facilitator superfamily transporter [Fusarium flagelliforme]|uniref:Major facilitator superfamily transporter n=1 Tax=Fusarium flagelliforme TaxID=2675880 RepID=A0A395MA17_9HYPO|nr:major facilitator superfamily transporter [Fusarium flagelliforme]